MAGEILKEILQGRCDFMMKHGCEPTRVTISKQVGDDIEEAMRGWPFGFPGRPTELFGMDVLEDERIPVRSMEFTDEQPLSRPSNWPRRPDGNAHE